MILLLMLFNVAMAEKTLITTDYRKGNQEGNSINMDCEGGDRWSTYNYVPGDYVNAHPNCGTFCTGIQNMDNGQGKGSWLTESYPNHNNGWWKLSGVWGAPLYTANDSPRGPTISSMIYASKKTCEAISECMMVIISSPDSTGYKAHFYSHSNCIPAEDRNGNHKLTIIRYELSPAKCSTLTCPTGYAANNSASALECASSTCDESVDLDICCAPACSVFNCDNTKKQKIGAVLPSGKQAHSRYCCVPKVRGCKNESAFNYNELAEFDDPSLCLFECEHGTLQGSLCVCDMGYDGLKCNRLIYRAAKNDFLKHVRIHANPTVSQLRERGNAVKDYARDVLHARLKTLSVKDAVKQSRFEVEVREFSKKTQKLIEGLGTPMVAVSPSNHYADDTCHEGANSSNCVSFDLNSDTDTVTILSTGTAIGSWSVLARGSTIFTKQTRAGATTFDMQCWDEATKEWGAVTFKDTSSDSETYECHGYVFMVSSQAGVCTGQCEHGTCATDGELYVCQCDAGWMGTHCDVLDNRSHCFETECVNYGGYKADAGVCSTCDVPNCCVYPTQSDYNTFCESLSSLSSYLSARCCDRTAC